MCAFGYAADYHKKVSAHYDRIYTETQSLDIEGSEFYKEFSYKLIIETIDDIPGINELFMASIYKEMARFPTHRYAKEVKSIIRSNYPEEDIYVSRGNQTYREVNSIYHDLISGYISLCYDYHTRCDSKQISIGPNGEFLVFDYQNRLWGAYKGDGTVIVETKLYFYSHSIFFIYLKELTIFVFGKY